MSVSDAAFATAPARMAPRLFVTFLAVAVVAACITLIVWWLAPTAAPPVRNPFGMGLREATPSGDIGAYILAVQSAFYKNLQQALAAVKDHGGAIWSLLSIGFAYGVFHAAGPGHGKGVIAAYLVADERALAKGFALSLAAAIVQALVAIALVGILAILFNATAATMGRVVDRGGDGELRDGGASRRRSDMAQERQASRHLDIQPQSVRRRSNGGLRPCPPAAARRAQPADEMA